MDDLSDEDREILIALIDEAIRESHFPLSPRSERLRAIRDKLRNREMAEPGPPNPRPKPRRSR